MPTFYTTTSRRSGGGRVNLNCVLPLGAVSYSLLSCLLLHIYLHSSLNYTLSGNIKSLEDARHLGQRVLKNTSGTRLGALLLANACSSCMVLTVILTKHIFLGELSAIESTKLMDRMVHFAFLKIILLGTVVVPDPNDIILYAVCVFFIGFLKCFVGLARDRCDSLLSNPTATWSQHARCAALLATVLCSDIAWIQASLRFASLSIFHYTVWHQPLLFDGISVAVEGLHAGARYWMQLSGFTHSQSQTEPSGASESRSQMLYALELLADAVLYLLSLAYYAVILRLRGGLRMHIADFALLLDLRCMAAAAWHRGQGAMQYRRLSFRVSHSFPDASEEELLGDDTRICVICMEAMKAAKVLPCGHLFHPGCLRSWLQHGKGTQGFTCPLCRSDLLMDGDDSGQSKHEASSPSSPSSYTQVGLGFGFGMGHAVPPWLDDWELGCDDPTEGLTDEESCISACSTLRQNHRQE